MEIKLKMRLSKKFEKKNSKFVNCELIKGLNSICNENPITDFLRSEVTLSFKTY